MNFIEFLSFVAALLFMAITMRQKGKRPPEEEREAEEDDLEAEEQAKRLREFLSGMKEDMRETSPRQPKQLPPRPRSPSPKTHAVPQSKKKSALERGQPFVPQQSFAPLPSETDAYAIQKRRGDEYPKKDAYAITKKEKSRAYNLLHHLKSRQDMIILHEIIGPPKALKSDEYGKFFE